MKRTVAAGLLVLLLVAVGVLFLQQKPKTKSPVKLTPHVYNDSSKSLEQVDLFVFYAVPRNLAGKEYAQWREKLDSLLPEIQNFYQLQMHGSSALAVKIYPKAVLLEQDDLFYDTASTKHGNPEALRKIVPELERRFVRFLSSANFKSIAVVYEGVGASGSEGAMILSRNFITDPEYAGSASALFMHEFAHTLGLPDQYDLETGIAFSSDILGAGRDQQLSTNYIDPRLLAGLGVGGE